MIITNILLGIIALLLLFIAWSQGAGASAAASVLHDRLYQDAQSLLHQLSKLDAIAQELIWIRTGIESRHDKRTDLFQSLDAKIGGIETDIQSMRNSLDSIDTNSR